MCFNFFSQASFGTSFWMNSTYVWYGLFEVKASCFAILFFQYIFCLEKLDYQFIKNAQLRTN